MDLSWISCIASLPDCLGDWQAIAAAPLPSLRRLDLTANPMLRGAAGALARAAWLPALTQLRVSGVESDRSVGVLVQPPAAFADFVAQGKLDLSD